MNNCCKNCYQGAYHCANTYCACHGLRPVAPSQEELPQATEKLPNYSRIEPWLSIEGVLCDVEAKAISVAKGMKLIRGYLETTTHAPTALVGTAGRRVHDVKGCQCADCSTHQEEPWVAEVRNLIYD